MWTILRGTRQHFIMTTFSVIQPGPRLIPYNFFISNSKTKLNRKSYITLCSVTRGESLLISHANYLFWRTDRDGTQRKHPAYSILTFMHQNRIEARLQALDCAPCSAKYLTGHDTVGNRSARLDLFGTNVTPILQIQNLILLSQNWQALKYKCY